MKEDESATEFLRGLEAGEESALHEAYIRFADRLLLVAQREIGDQLRRHYGPEDAVLSGIGSFCIRAATGRYQFDHTGALWKLLRTFTLNKIRRAAQRHRAELDAATEIDEKSANVEPCDRAPAPGEVAGQIDEMEAFLSRFSTRDVQVCRLWFEGYSSVEIANRVGLSKATVDRVRRHIREAIRDKLVRDDEQ